MKLIVICAVGTKFINQIGVWAIKKSEGTSFSHFAIFDGTNVWESVFPSSRTIDITEWLTHYKPVKTYIIDLLPSEYEQFIEILEQNTPKDYSVFQLFLIWCCNALGILEVFLNKIIWNGNKALICSEYVAEPISKVLKYDFKKSIDVVGMDEVEAALKKIGHEVLI